MTFLAALALGGVAAADRMAAQWRSDAASLLTVQVPHPTDPAALQGHDTRISQVLAVMRANPHLSRIRPMPEAEMQELLRPWLGTVTGEGGPAALALGLPAIIEAHVDNPDLDLTDLGGKLAAAAPGAMAESSEQWTARLATLARTLQLCAELVLVLVVFVAASVVVLTVRAGLAVRREAIGIVHNLGASDSYIAQRFADRTGRLSGLGALGGAGAAMIVLLGLSGLSSPFVDAGSGRVLGLTPGLWATLPILPASAAALGWATAQIVVRRWLQHLP
jgi:cell division transport system permease protein